ncbi:MAG TPA: histidine phosphatase family protein [Patescibacteria group bacterium]|nr:histidine phosphatase family protein [Patescibacteria group bacterium]
MRLYLIRHGESTANFKKVHQSALEPLSEIGKKQAQFVAKRFKHLPVDLILVSPYTRARQTAAELKTIVTAPLEVTDLLRETKKPSEFVGKKLHDQSLSQAKNIMRQNSDDIDFRYADEDTFAETCERAKQLLALVITKHKKNIVLVTHGDFLRMILSVMMFGKIVTPKEHQSVYSFYQTHNTGITICEYTKDENWRLLTFNDHSHLEELLNPKS